MNRRKFIGVAATGAAAVVVLPTAAWSDESALAALARPRLLDIIRDDRIVCDLGRRYGESFPRETDTNALTEAILGQPLGQSSNGAFSPESVEALVGERVRADFAAGNTVTVHGWVLSVTEAR